MSTLLDLYLRNSSVNKDKVAVRFDDGKCQSESTYSELDDASDLLFGELTIANRGQFKGKTIGVILTPGVTMPAVLIGIWKAGGAYCALDSSLVSCIERVTNIIQRLDITCFIIDSTMQRFIVCIQSIWRKENVKTNLIEPLNITVIYLTSLQQPLPESESETNDLSMKGEEFMQTKENNKTNALMMKNEGPLQIKENDIHCQQFVNINPSDIAYVVTTSGSTGVPKIVRVPHQCIVPNITHIRKIYKLEARDVVFQASPLTFDPSIVEIMTCFLSGATLLCVSEAVKLWPPALIECLAKRNCVTVLQVTPSFLAHISSHEHLSKNLLSRTSSLRLLCLGGEPCPLLSAVRSWREEGNRTVIYQLYGITEVSSWATWNCVLDGNDSVTSTEKMTHLGYPLEGTHLEARNVDPETSLGELWIGGAYRVCLIDDEQRLVPGTMRFSGDLVRVVKLDEQYDTSVKEPRPCPIAAQFEFLANSSLLVPSDVETDVKPGYSLLGKRLRCQDVDHPFKEQFGIGMPLVEHMGMSMKEQASGDMSMIDQTSGNLPMKEIYYYVGRSDDVVKRNGKRLNLLEISEIAMRSAHLHKAVAVYDLLQLILFIQPLASSESTDLNSVELLHEVRSMLLQWLPNHYQPDEIMIVSSMPLTKHDKVDKRKLMGLFKNRMHSDVVTTVRGCKQNSEHSAIYDLVRRLIEKNGLYYENWLESKFLELGGDSLTAVRLTNEIQHVLPSANLNELLDVLLHQSLQYVIRYINSACAEAESNIQDVSTTADILSRQQQQTNFHSNIENYSSSDDNVTIKLVQNNLSPVMSKSSASISHQQYSNMGSSQLMHFKKTPADYTRKINVNSEHISKKIKLEEYSGISFSSEAVQNKMKSEIMSNIKADQLHGPDDLLVNKTVRSFIEDSEVVLCIHRGSQITNLSSRSCGHHSCCSDISRVSDVQLSVVWSLDIGKCVDASPIIARLRDGSSAAYIGSHSHRFIAVRVGDGQKLWEYKTADRIESSACISSCGQFVCFGCYDGCMYVLKRETGDVVYKHQTSSMVKSSPRAYANQLIVGSHDGCLHVVNTETQQSQVIKIELGSIFSTPCIDMDRNCIVIGTLGGHLICINQLDDGIIWTKNLGKPLFSSPVLTQHGYCVGSVDHTIYCIGFNGEMVWSYSTMGLIFSTGCVTSVMRNKDGCEMQSSIEKKLSTPSDHLQESVLVIGSHDCHVHCITAREGELLWKTRLNAQVYSTPFASTLCNKYNAVQYNEVLTSPSSPESNVKGVKYCDAEFSDTVINYNLNKSQSCCQYSDKLEHTIAFQKPSVDHKYLSNIDICGNRFIKWSCNSSHCCNVIIACSTIGTLYILDSLSGSILAEHNLPGEVFSSPVVVDDKIVVGCRDNNVYCLSMNIK